MTTPLTLRTAKGTSLTIEEADANFESLRVTADAAFAAVAGLSNGMVGKATLALLNADLAYADGTVAYVTNDSTPANNGTYRKSGASGAGSWVQSNYDRVALVETRANSIYNVWKGDGLTKQQVLLKLNPNDTDLITTDWQGKRVLDPNARQNLFTRTGWSGGSPPADWLLFEDGTGSSAEVSSLFTTAVDGASAWLFTATTAARRFLYRSMSLLASTTYSVSVSVEALTGSVIASDALAVGTFPAGAAVTYPICAANPTGGATGAITTGRLEVQIAVSGTAGSSLLRFGIANVSTGKTVQLSRPQLEIASQATHYLPSGAASAAQAEYTVDASDVVTTLLAPEIDASTYWSPSVENRLAIVEQIAGNTFNSWVADGVKASAVVLKLAAGDTVLQRTSALGTYDLSTSARTNRLLNSKMTGGGTTPTSWSKFGAGTTADATSDFGSADGSRAWQFTAGGVQTFFYQTTPSLSAVSTHCLSVLVEQTDGVTTAGQIFSYSAAPAGTVITFPACSANPAGGQGSVVVPGVLEMVVAVAATPGTISLRVGSWNTTKLSRPQFNEGSTRIDFIPTGTVTTQPGYSVDPDTGLVSFGFTPLAGDVLAWRPDTLEVPQSAVTGLEADLGNALDLVLPPTIYTVVGREMNVYFDNLIADDATDYRWDVTCTQGLQQEERWTSGLAPTAGTTTITVAVHNKHNETPITSATASLVVKAAAAGTGVNRKCLFIGDSTTAGGITTGEVVTIFSTDAMAVTLIGTKGTGANLHEGISGWTINKFYTDATSPFYFGGAFNFSTYMSTNGYSGLNYVFINLGINDVFSKTSDAGVSQLATTMLAQLEAMITNIHTYDANIKIGLAVTTPPPYNNDAFGASYGCGQTRWRFKRNLLLWSRLLINQFQGREVADKVYLVPLSLNLDTVHNMLFNTAAPWNSRTSLTTQRIYNGVHPDTPGYYQSADTYHAFLKGQE